MEIFNNKKPNFKKIKQYGFIKLSDKYNYTTDILDGEFELSIDITFSGEIKTKMIEKETQEEFTLHLIKYADGSFIGKIKEEYDKILISIANSCFDNNIFKSPYTYKIMDYIESKYKDEAEYLWEKFPDNAIYRRKDSKKWYAAILTVKRNKFGFDSDENTEVIDLHATPEDVKQLTQQPNIYPGYHMNKKYWITIILDGSLAIDKIYQLIDKSYESVKK